MLFELSGLGYRYTDGSPALVDISVQIGQQERVVVLGANGSGKSTLLKVLTGLLFPDSGSVRFRNEEISEKTLAGAELRQRFRQSVGFIFQNPDAQLFNATVWEELAFGPRQMGFDEASVAERVTSTLQFLGIQHLAERPPFRLSGGEKRKVAIGSVLSMNPEVLVLDEPFLGLDPRSQAWLIRTLDQLYTAGKTIILATHTLEILPRVASRAIVLSEEHRMIGEGPIGDILENRDLLRQANLI